MPRSYSGARTAAAARTVARWTPAEYFKTDLLGEWSADDATVTLTDALVHTIASRGYNAVPLVNATGAAMEYRAFYRNNRACLIDPNGSRQMNANLIATALSGVKHSVSVVLCAGCRTTLPSHGNFWALGNSGDDSKSHFRHGVLSGKYYINRTDHSPATVTVQSTGAADSSVHVYEFVYDGGADTILHSVDGAAADPSAAFAAALGSCTFDRFAIGCIDRTSAAYWLNIAWAHILVIGRAITSTERGLIRSYLASEGHGVATVAQTTQVVAIGNSHTAGGGATVATNGWSYKMRDALRSAGKSLCYANFGIGSQTTTSMISRVAAQCTDQLSGSPPAKVVVVQEIINDYGSPQTVAQCKTNMTSLVTAIHAAHPTAKVVNCPCYPHSIMSEADRTELNNWLAAKGDGADLALDWSALPLMAAGENLSTTWYNADQVHLNDAGHAACAAASATQIASLIL